MANRAFFVVIEGLDGSGKSELSRRLAHMLRQTLGERVLLTFEPHDPSAAGIYIRQVLTRQISISPRTLALAFALNRADHNERVITPFIAGDGDRVVICDRYYLSSLVYQSTPDLPMPAVMALNVGARRPDLTLFLDASAETCYARMGARGGDRELFEQNLANTRAKYYQAITFLRTRGEKVMMVDANPDLLVVLNTIVDTLNDHGPDWLMMQRLLLLEDSTPVGFSPDAIATMPVNSEAELSSVLSRLGDVWRQADANEDVRHTLGRLYEAARAEAVLLPPAQLGALFLADLRRLGYEVGAPLPWSDAAAYEIMFALPPEMAQRGAALVLNESGRFDTITRKMQALEQHGREIGSAYNLLLVFDPGSPTAQYDADASLKLSASTRVFGWGEIAAFLFTCAAEQFYVALERPDLEETFREALAWV